MTIKDRTKKQTVKTTTLIINRVEDDTLLREHFYVVRYVIPEALRHRNNSTDFGHVHNTIRDQITYPYKSFLFDTLDEGKPKQWAVYVLYPQDVSAKELTLSWYKDVPLPQRKVTFTEIPLHILLKLLQISFFHSEKIGRFVGRDTCYAYARPGGEDFHYCVELELQGTSTNTKTVSTEMFRVIPHAKRFGTITPPFQPDRRRFGKRVIGERFYFMHLSTEEATQEPVLYDIVTIPGKRAKVKYHDPRNINAGSGKIVYDFVQQFLRYLANLGIIGQPQIRTLTKVQSPQIPTLPIQQLGTVGVYDNRLNRRQSLVSYIGLFNNLHPDVHFVALEDITQAPQSGVLILLDAKADDFAEDGILRDEKDPYPPLYAAHPKLPKQSLNVNLNDPNALQGRNYLDYQMLQSDEPLKRNLDVVLSELYLKCTLIHGFAQFPLPLLSKELAFVRRRNIDDKTVTIVLCFEKDQLHLIDLGDPTQNKHFYQLLDTWGVQWDEQYEQLLAERQRIREDGTRRDLTQFDIIVGEDLFVAIEDMQERVLYEYDTINQRHHEQQALYPITHFQLAPKYDQIQQIRSGLLPFEQLSQRGLLDEDQEPAHITEKEQKSLLFYKHLIAYDALLAKIAGILSIIGGSLA